MKHGWAAGRNLRLDFRFDLGGPDRLSKCATELVARAPDVLFSGGGSAAAALQQATATLPIVFANALDPVAEGWAVYSYKSAARMRGLCPLRSQSAFPRLDAMGQISDACTAANPKNSGRSRRTCSFSQRTSAGSVTVLVIDSVCRQLPQGSIEFRVSVKRTRKGGPPP
jgi:putative ABC transport system substrate-binding protein